MEERVWQLIKSWGYKYGERPTHLFIGHNEFYNIASSKAATEGRFMEDLEGNYSFMDLKIIEVGERNYLAVGNIIEEAEEEKECSDT